MSPACISLRWATCFASNRITYLCSADRFSIVLRPLLASGRGLRKPARWVLDVRAYFASLLNGARSQHTSLILWGWVTGQIPAQPGSIYRSMPKSAQMHSAGVSSLLRPPSQHSPGCKESAAVFDGIPCWTPLSDAIVSTIDTNHAARNPSAPHPSIRCAKAEARTLQSLSSSLSAPASGAGVVRNL